MSKGIIILVLFVFTMFNLTSCVGDNNLCTDEEPQLPVPRLKIAIVNSSNGKSKFREFTDTNNYNPDSVVLYLYDNTILSFTKPFKKANDSLISTYSWTYMDYYSPKLDKLYIRYAKNKFDTLTIEYNSHAKNCANKNFVNYYLNKVTYKSKEIVPTADTVYTIIK